MVTLNRDKETQGLVVSPARPAAQRNGGILVAFSLWMRDRAELRPSCEGEHTRPR